jgi:hypothetical protein
VEVVLLARLVGVLLVAAVVLVVVVVAHQVPGVLALLDREKMVEIRQLVLVAAAVVTQLVSQVLVEFLVLVVQDAHLRFLEEL